MRQPWTCARCDQPILKGQPFATAIVPRRLPNPGVVSGKVLVHKNEEDCKTLRRGSAKDAVELDGDHAFGDCGS